MAIKRQQQFLGQGRVDVPHMRSIELALANDFDLLAGSIMGGQKALVVRGFEVITNGAYGAPATSLQINVANSILIHPLATESGSIFSVASDQPLEILDNTNPKVIGSFTANTVNFVGVDLRRTADGSTSDLVQFLDANTNLEVPKTVPLARTLGYIFIISTQDFSSTPGVCPIAKIKTDASNNIESLMNNGIEDARNVYFRLGSGGSTPQPFGSFSFPGGRTETGDNSNFNEADKSINSLKDWSDAAMTRIWEVGGGEHWYSPTADRNVTLSRTDYQGGTFTNGEYFEWDGTNLHWKGLKFIFDNSTGYYNEIAAQTTDSAGLTDLAAGECLYVDIDRTQNRTGGSALQAQKGILISLGMSTVPGARQVIAWRIDGQIFTRGVGWPVGSSFNPATKTSLGVVELTLNPTDVGFGDNLTPRVPVVDTSYQAIATGLTRGALASGNINIAQGTNDTNLNIGHGTSFISSFTGQVVVSSPNVGVAAMLVTGNGTDPAGEFIGGANGDGIAAAAFGATKAAVRATAAGNAHAAVFTGSPGTTADVLVLGFGAVDPGYLGGNGVVAIAKPGDNGAAFIGVGDGNGSGGSFTGGTSNGAGVIGISGGPSAGVYGFAAAASGTGGYFRGGTSGITLQAKNNTSTNDSDIFQSLNSADVVGYAIDHNGYPLGNVIKFEETWNDSLVSVTPLTSLFTYHGWRVTTEDGNNDGRFFKTLNGFGSSLLGSSGLIILPGSANDSKIQLFSGYCDFSAYGGGFGSSHFYFDNHSVIVAEFIADIDSTATTDHLTFAFGLAANNSGAAGGPFSADGGADNGGQQLVFYRKASQSRFWYTFSHGTTNDDTVSNIADNDTPRRFKIELHGPTSAVGVANGAKKVGRFFIDGILKHTVVTTQSDLPTVGQSLGFRISATVAGTAGNGHQAAIGRVAGVWNIG